MQEDVLKLVNDQLNELPSSEKARKAADDLIEELAFCGPRPALPRGENHYFRGKIVNGRAGAPVPITSPSADGLTSSRRPESSTSSLRLAPYGRAYGPKGIKTGVNSRVAYVI